MTALQPLWQLDEELTELLDSVATCDEELQPELQAKIAEYTAAGAVKVDQCAHVIAALEYAQKNRKDEIARMQDEIRSAAKAQERLEAYLCRVIAARGRPLKGNTSTLSVRSSDAVEVTDEAYMPDEFKTAIVTMPYSLWSAIFDAAKESIGGDLWPSFIDCAEKIDKAGVKKALKAGESVPGADLVYRSNLVRR